MIAVEHFPVEKGWYAKRVPKLHVEFVGHPMVERMQKSEVRSQSQNISGFAENSFAAR